MIFAGPTCLSQPINVLILILWYPELQHPTDIQVVYPQCRNMAGEEDTLHTLTEGITGGFSVEL